MFEFPQRLGSGVLLTSFVFQFESNAVRMSDKKG